MNRDLDQISSLLRKDAVNYSVFLRMCEVSSAGVGRSDAYVRACFGDEIVLGGVEEVDGEKAVDEIIEALCFAGDEEAGPSPALLKSQEFTEAVGRLKHELSETVRSSKKVEKFWVSENHPAYPVFWDFGFLFFLGEKVIVFIGSSSD